MSSTSSRTACPVCTSTRATPLFWAPFPEYADDGHRAYPLSVEPPVACWQIVRCASCGVGYPDPYPDEEVIRSYYRDQAEPSQWELDNYVRLSPHAQDFWAEFAGRVTGLARERGKVLEVGCAAGWALKGCRDLGWQAVGLEASPKFATFAHDELGLDVVQGELGDAASLEALDARGPFDVIYLTDVLEHLHDPVADLQRLRGLLSPDGRIVIATLDLDSRGARRYGLDWRQIVVSHIVYWTRPAMREALARAGLVVVDEGDFDTWAPDPRERRRRARAARAKYAARAVLLRTYVPAARRSPTARRLPSLLTRGRVDHQAMLHKIGEQPIIGDVMLVVAAQAPRAGVS